MSHSHNGALNAPTNTKQRLQRKKILAERIRSVKEALKDERRSIEEEKKKIRDIEKLIATLTQQVRAYVDSMSESPDITPSLSSQPRTPGLPAPTLEESPTQSVEPARKQSQIETAPKQSTEKKMTTVEKNGLKVAKKTMSQVIKIAESMGTAFDYAVEQLCEKIPGIAEYFLGLLGTVFYCLGKPAIALIREKCEKGCKYAIYAGLIFLGYYKGVWNSISGLLSLLAAPFTGAYKAIRGAIEAWQFVSGTINNATEAVAQTAEFVNETVFNKTKEWDETVRNGTYLNQTFHGFEQVLKTNPIKELRKLVNITTAATREMADGNMFTGPVNAAKCIYDGFEEQVVKPLANLFIMAAAELAKEAVLGLALIAAKTSNAALLPGRAVAGLIVATEKFVSNALVVFQKRVKRLPFIGSTQAREGRLKLPAVSTLRFGNTAVEKALVDISDMTLRIAHGNDNYLRIEDYNSNMYTPRYLGYNAEHMEVTLGQIDIQLEQLNDMSNIPGNADIFVGNQKPGGLLEWAKGWVSNRPTNRQILQESVGTLQETLLDYKEQNELYESLQSQWQAVLNADPTDGSIDALNDKMNVLRTIANGIQSVQNHPSVKAVVDSALRLKGSGPLACPNVESMNDGTKKLMFTVLGAMQTTISNLLNKYGKDEATIKAKLRQEKEVIDKEQERMRGDGWRLSMNDKPYQEPTGPKQGFNTLGWSGGSQARPGQLAIAAPVVADPHENLLQRPMRVDYVSAATNLVKVNCEVEECEEEK